MRPRSGPGENVRCTRSVRRISPGYLITVELMSEAFNPDGPGINGSELDLGFFHQTLPVSVQALLPGILADVDWDRHAMDWGY